MSFGSVQTSYTEPGSGVVSRVWRDLAIIVTNEGTFSMKTHRPSRYVILRTGGSVRSARPTAPARTVRAQATRGILAPALMLITLGAGLAASPGHSVAGQIRVSAHQPAQSLAIRATADSMSSCQIDNRLWLYAIEQMPWMYAPIGKMPWMYAGIGKMPWMYAAVRKMPWMYAGVRKMPWMYAPLAGHTSPARGCVLTFPLTGSLRSPLT
jgi:hypothetical protein